MSPIEEHWISLVGNDLQVLGVSDATISVRSADAENWRFRIAARNREFEIGFNHRDRFWARETTPQREKHLLSNDHPPIHDSAQARQLGVRLVALALADPAFPPRDPPVI